MDKFIVALSACVIRSELLALTEACDLLVL